MVMKIRKTVNKKVNRKKAIDEDSKVVIVNEDIIHPSVSKTLVDSILNLGWVFLHIEMVTLSFYVRL
jgi:hypothetical protein